MESLFERFVREEDGQGVVEYVLILALIAIGGIGVMGVLKNSISNEFNKIGNKLT